MKQILRQTLTIAGALCLTIGGIAAQPSLFASQETFKTQYILGINFMPEWQIDLRGRVMGGGNDAKFAPNVGISFEARITRHSGIETGFYCRNLKYPGGISLADPNTRYSSSYSHYFAIPVLYKYYSRILNVGAGISYDFRFSQSDNRTSDANNRFGLMVKVGKDITLYKGLFLEPESHFNPFVDDGDWNGLARISNRLEIPFLIINPSYPVFFREYRAGGVTPKLYYYEPNITLPGFRDSPNDILHPKAGFSETGSASICKYPAFPSGD